MQLKNKNIFITGSSRGIGLAIAHKFAQAGANIVLNSRGLSQKNCSLSFQTMVSRWFLYQETYPILQTLSVWLRKLLQSWVQ